MNENKAYVSQVLENGTIQISEDVIVSIAASAIRDVDGVYGIGNAVASDLTRLTKKGAGKGIRAVISAENEISVDCYIIVYYGHAVVDVAKAVQEAVTSAVESTTGHAVSSVNVSVGGITLPKTKK